MIGSICQHRILFSVTLLTVRSKHITKLSKENFIILLNFLILVIIKLIPLKNFFMAGSINTRFNRYEYIITQLQKNIHYEKYIQIIQK